MVGILATTDNLSRSFLCDMFTILKQIHIATDGLGYRFCQDDLPKISEHFVADIRRGLPLQRAYEMHQRKGKKWTSAEPSYRLFPNQPTDGTPVEPVQSVFIIKDKQGGFSVTDLEIHCHGVRDRHVRVLPIDMSDGS